MLLFSVGVHAWMCSSVLILRCNTAYTHAMPPLVSGPGRSGERLLTGREMSAILGCSVETLRRWRRDGILRAGVFHRLGTRWVRYDPALIRDELREKGKR